MHILLLLSKYRQCEHSWLNSLPLMYISICCLRLQSYAKYYAITRTLKNSPAYDICKE
uniref:Uncharacterized protein n=1 Tax=Arundo donax TaxID=35708 RepID=A0A0A9BS26_ARUDO